jgi:hypothetical protein
MGIRSARQVAGWGISGEIHYEGLGLWNSQLDRLQFLLAIHRDGDSLAGSIRGELLLDVSDAGDDGVVDQHDQIITLQAAGCCHSSVNDVVDKGWCSLDDVWKESESELLSHRLIRD